MSWEEKALDEMGFVGRGKSKHRPRDAAHLYGGPYPLIQTGDVKHADLYVTSYTQTYSEAGLEQSKLWPKGTLCITIAANIAETAILNLDACFPDSIVGFVADDKKCDARFIKYKLDTIKQQYQQVSQGATQDNLSLEKLLAFKLYVPAPEMQRRIAEMLTNYGDMIENNRQRIMLLEEAARLLHREWFVHLRFPGHEHTDIVNGVPVGWKSFTLGALCIDVRQTVSPENLEPDTPYIGLEHIPRRSISISTWARADAVTSTKLRFKVGDILFGKIRPYFHKVGIAFIDGVSSSDAIVIRTNQEEFWPLVLMTVSSDRFVAEVSQTMREGSKMPRADWKQMVQYRIVLPPPGLLQTFSENIYAITRQLKNLTLQNHKLRAARDLLLPRLIDGTITV